MMCFNINPTNIRCSICGGDHNNSNCSYVKVTEHIIDNIVPSRAKLSLPQFMKLELLSDGTYTVKTQKSLGKGTKFGPLQAEKNDNVIPEAVFPVGIFATDDAPSYYLHFNDENKCNWLIFISPAEDLDEQNLICYQEEDQIFYVAVKDLEAGDVLKVWYSPYYGLRMGKKMLESKKTEDILQNIDMDNLIKTQQKIMEREVWTCKFCGQMEYKIVTFAQHMVNHYSAQLKKHCEICKTSFNLEKSLKSHLKIVHNTQIPSKPPEKSKESIPNPQAKDMSVGGPLLNDIFNDSSDLPQSDLNQFELDLDNQNLLLDSDNITDNLRDLDHFNFEIDDNQKSLVCDICLKQFTKLKYLIVHMRQHTGENVCVKCMKVFCRRENLDSHMCNARANLTCIICDKNFTQKKYLSRHIASAHLEKYKCSKCSKNYNSNLELKQHNCSGVSVEEKETFVCSICDKVFYRLLYLKKHMKIHSRNRNNLEKTSICDQCGVHLKNANSYYLHKKKHNIENLTCNICEKKFHRKDALAAHSTLHKQRSQVECKQCEKTFKTLKILQAHVKQTHINQQKYECSECKVAFKQKCSLNKHMQIIHKKKSQTIRIDFYTCPICNTQIKLKSSLLRHIQKLHPGHKNKDKAITQMNIEQDTEQITTEPESNEFDEKNDILTDAATLEQINEICLSIPELGDKDEEITLDNNAYILDNGNIVQPQDGKVVIYVLNTQS